MKRDMIRLTFHFFTHLMVLLAISNAAWGASSAVSMDTSALLSGQFFQSESLGWRFSVSQPLLVTSLGQFDSPSTSPGLLGPAQVGIFDQIGALLLSATVPTGTNVELDGWFRFVPVQGVILEPGMVYTIASATRDISLLATPVSILGTSAIKFSVDPRVTSLGARYGNDLQLTMPLNGADVPEYAPSLFLGPNFRFDVVAVPEPSTALMICLGLFALSARRSPEPGQFP